MDKDYRGHVRFKDFCKFVKKHKKGKAYKAIDEPSSPDSSMFSSEEVDLHARAIWKNYIDPERECLVYTYKVVKALKEHPTQTFSTPETAESIV